MPSISRSVSLLALVAPLFLSHSSTLVAAQGQTHQVLVGQGGLNFAPANLSAQVGDKVEFVWVAGAKDTNHSVTQSSFDEPCTPLNNGTPIGFDSGFNARLRSAHLQPVKSTAKESPAWVLEITNASAPIWWFCAQQEHCQQGMVGSINAALTGNKTFEAFRSAAMGAAANGSAGGTAVGSGVGATATGPVSTASATSSPASSAPPSLDVPVVALMTIIVALAATICL